MYFASDQRLNRIIMLPALDADALQLPLVPPASFGALSRPAGICLDSNRNLHIADFDNGRIVTVALDTATWTAFGAGTLGHPLDVAIDAMSRIYAVDGLRVVRAEAADGSGAIVLSGLQDDQRPIAVTLDANDRLFVVDAKSRGLAFTEDDGDSWEALALPAGEKPSRPVSIGPRRDGGVLVVDLANRRVVAIEVDGTSSIVVDASDGLIAPVCAREDGPGITVLDAGAGWIRRFLPVGDRHVAADFVRGRRADGTARFDRLVGLSVGATS